MPQNPSMEQFLGAGEPGDPIPVVDQQLMWQLAKMTAPINRSRWVKSCQRHKQFIEQGGLGGEWQILLIKGITMAHYQHSNVSKKQALFERGNFEHSDWLESTELPFSSFCGCWGPDLKATSAVLFHSIWVDAFLERADFRHSVLYRSDFSRAQMKEANFQGADLRHCDFEHSDLTGANFRGAQIEGARFYGANLDGVKR